MTASLVYPLPRIARVQTQPLELRGRLHAYLPEPIPNRAEALEGVDLARWLREVIASDRGGFAVLAGGGTTFILLYADGTPIAASLAGHGEDADGADALHRLLGQEGLNVFALTYMCESAVALALSALFVPGGPRLRLDAEARALAACLAAANGERASGALVVDAGLDSWSVVLLVDGAVVAGYGADDRSLKPGIDDATVLLHLDQLWVTRLAPHVDDLSAALAELETGNAPEDIDAGTLAIESALIGLLARLEHQLTRASASGAGECRSLVSAAFATILGELDQLPTPADHEHDIEIATRSSASAVPADAALNELIEQFAGRIAGYVAWLARSDDASARFLHDATSELVQQARTIVRG